MTVGSVPVADPVTGRVRVVAERCGTCDFRPGRHGSLAPGQLARLVAGCLSSEGHLVCHETGEDRGMLGAVCAGFAAHPDAHRSLALRVAAAGARLLQHPSPASDSPAPERSGEEPAELTQLSPPATGPHTVRPGGHARPRARRGGRRRPTPIITTDPGAEQYLAFGYVTQLCTTILRSHEIDTLTAFAADYDEAGARTFGCLLYSLDKRESALYWWRFAAGAGDPLAAHLLAAHHAAIGPTTEARAWRAISQMLAFTPERHVPEPVRHRTELAESFAREIPLRDEMRVFMRYPHLPGALVAQ
ncbi:hypothetical protein ABT143_12930 [Streptomyces sp. NPDC002033]|uniref:hypothetical protein n=1 Tax=unclassified Streptomyces TaxID=2593676 RepID=UPI00332C45F7